MKKIFLLLIAASLFCAVKAQVVEEGEAALVYYSPKTAILLDFIYTEETHESGLYAEFAEAMLGIDGAVTENQKSYTLKDVRIGTRTATDYERPHKVVPEEGIPLLLSVNEKNLLVGYNLPPDMNKAEKKQPLKENENGSKSKKIPFRVSPFPEDVLEAATPLAQANAVAKQIFHLRETRMYLLNGEVEHAPADGESMKLVLAELDKQEQALTELFVGKKHKKTEHKQVVLAPEKQEMSLYFSAENGFTHADNIDADTIQISVALHPQKAKQTEGGKKKKKGAEVSQIVYNLPGSGDVKVVYDGQVLAKKTVPIAQLGIDVPLPKSLFTEEGLPVITVSEKTGNIISISK